MQDNNDLVIFSVNRELYTHLQELDKIVDRIVINNHLTDIQNKALVLKIKNLNQELRGILNPQAIDTTKPIQHISV